MEKIFKYRAYLILFLILVNIISHFIPFERESLGPDDYVALLRSKAVRMMPQISHELLDHPDRPLLYAALVVQSKLTDDNGTIGLLLVLFSSTIVLLAVFFLLNALFANNFLAFVGSFIFCLLPNKLETYHTPVFFTVNVAIFIYILSVIFFIYFTKGLKKVYLAAALFTYTIGIFWYEIGFFLPAVIATYALLYRKEATRSVLYFAIPVIFYSMYRLTGSFGFTSPAEVTHRLSLTTLPSIALLDLFHQYFGRYMARIILYGLYKFFSIEPLCLISIIFINVVLLFITALLIRKRELGDNINNKILIFAGILFVSFLVPFFLNAGGGLGGRHLALPSIGVAIFAIWLLEKIKKRWRAVLMTFIGVALIVCQGNAWTQVVACRINGAVYETMKDMKEELLKAENIIIDTKSFADNIPFTLVQRDFNVLNTYYGAQVFEDWGLGSMAKLATLDFKKPVYIAVTNPRVIENDFLTFSVFKDAGYRSKSRVTTKIDRESAVIINFRSVFGETFNNGARKNNLLQRGRK